MGKPNIIVLDLETKKAFDQVGRGNFGALGVSLVGVYSYRHREYQTYWENDFPKLYNLLLEKPLVIGFNQRRFDFPVLQPYFRDLDLNHLPMVDMLEDLTKTLGHRVKLDSLAEATLGRRKSGHGLDAIRYWNTGEYDKLEKYCLDDVKITKAVFEYGVRNKEVLFMDRYGAAKKRVGVDWILKAEETDEAEQLSLF